MDSRSLRECRRDPLLRPDHRLHGPRIHRASGNLRVRRRRPQGARRVLQQHRPDRCAAARPLRGDIQVTAAWLRETQKVNLAAVGHRVVHGGPDYDRPVLVDADLLADLERFTSLAPLHQPNNLEPIRILLERRPELPQVACFDTAFHRGHSDLADRYAIPETLYAEGVRRYGFHGLSYEYVAERLP